jgi:hypothetical protein
MFWKYIYIYIFLLSLWKLTMGYATTVLKETESYHLLMVYMTLIKKISS